jgi:hypothetical protein
MRCFSALKLAFKQKFISEFLGFECWDNFKPFETKLKLQMKPICKGQVAILRIEHLMVTTVAI